MSGPTPDDLAPRISKERIAVYVWAAERGAQAILHSTVLRDDVEILLVSVMTIRNVAATLPEDKRIAYLAKISDVLALEIERNEESST